MHRAQNDPLINDEDASPMVFTEVRGPSIQSTQPHKSSKVKDRGDLEDEFGKTFKPNEGEAAQHGVFYDDTQYDYMQHMRDLGSGSGPVTWIEAQSVKDKQSKGKGKTKLEDALRGMDLGESQSEGGLSSASSRSLLPEDVLGSEYVKRTTYQDQQDIPDTIAGFQPDMDPRLREVLEALEDEAYVDEEDDIFEELAHDGEELDLDAWESSGWDDEYPIDVDDAGWESDDTIKAGDAPVVGELPLPTAAPPADPSAGAWMEEFTKFKQDAKAAKGPHKTGVAGDTADLQSSAHTGLSSLASGRHKKRKGAKTSTTNYSMTSSALARTDTQTLLDARFDKIAEEYADDYDEEGQFDDAFTDDGSLASGLSRTSRMSKTSDMSGISRASGISTYSRASDAEAPQLVRSDFDGIMDDFLGGHSKQGKRNRVKKSGFQTGMEQLDEIRSGLGPARSGPGGRKAALKV